MRGLGEGGREGIEGSQEEGQGREGATRRGEGSIERREVTNWGDLEEEDTNPQSATPCLPSLAGARARVVSGGRAGEGGKKRRGCGWRRQGGVSAWKTGAAEPAEEGIHPHVWRGGEKMSEEPLKW